MTKTAIILSETIENCIIILRGQKVILSFHLAVMYGVEPRVLVRNVKRHENRFPGDFMFQLTDEEWRSLRSQFGIIDKGRGKHPKYRPYAFTEQGVAMLSSVLNSPRAVRQRLPSFRRELSRNPVPAPVNNVNDFWMPDTITLASQTSG